MCLWLTEMKKRGQKIARHKGDKSAFLFIDERYSRLFELCQCNGVSRKNITLCHTVYV